MNKRITIFIGSMGDGGAQRVVSILSKRMACENINVTILSYLDMSPSYFLDERVKMISVVKENGTNVIKNIGWIRHYFKENSDVVISFLAPFNMLAIVSSFFSGIPLIVADRNDPYKVPENFIIRKLRDFLYMFADGVVLQTKRNQGYFAKILKNSTVIYNPVTSLEGCWKYNEAYSRTIVSVGRLEEQKNQKLLINAFYRFFQDRPDYKLVIYGEGSYRSELEEHIRKCGLEGIVQLPGVVSDVINKEIESDVFVLSSDYEGMPNALIEAMCMGMPVISTEVSGAEDLIVDKYNGLLVPVNDEECLYIAIKTLTSDQDMMERLSKNAVELKKELAEIKIYHQWIEFIDKTIKLSGE